MDDRSQQVLAIGTTFFILAWIVVLLRIYVRAYMIKSWGVDDWVMMLALGCFTVYLVAQLGGVYFGTGRRNADLDPKDIEKALHFWYICELFYVIASSTLKVAIGLFLLRIAVKRIHILIIYFINGASIVFGAGYLFVVIFQCTPIHTFWTIAPNNEHCLPRDTVANITYAASALAAFADWTFGILPGFIVWDLHMNQRTKMVVVVILGFAAIGSTATLVRIPYIKGLKTRDDFLYETTDVAIWSTVEPGIGMTAACIATLRPLLQKILSKTGLSTPRTNPSRFTPNWGSSANQLGSKKQGYVRSPSYSHGMDTLRPDISGTRTTVTGGGNNQSGSDNSSEEHIIGGATRPGGLNISKSVEVTHVTETAPPRYPNERRSDDSMV
ncbi:integral membrane protein [Macrophomina phaseolina MS6]|uniref:Integral membrane protein n=2 Tax=Macrophomina phaseolina TaxID=35725 RepID=K2SDD1_MACPH|nr:integral membrane protein [Macrophomina phaseolina MS6]KAH7062141.1 hypothetical protein B0J12DRAFT_227745 [Macrophomina phaseolina]